MAREEAERRAGEEKKRKLEEEEERRQQEEKRRKEEAADQLRREEEAQLRLQEEAQERRKRAEEEEKMKRRLKEEEECQERERQKKLEEEKRRLEVEEEERRKLSEKMNRMEIDSSKKQDEGGKKHLRLTTERSKKPTMAREWRKLNQKNKSRTETEVVEKKKKEVVAEPAPPPPPPVAPPPIKYVPPVYKENEHYQDRLGSFLNGWPHTNKKGVATPAELAEAGFFLVGPGDFSKCFQCGIELMCWEPFESPWVRHAFLSQSCCYVERIKGRDWIESVQRGEF